MKSQLYLAILFLLTIISCSNFYATASGLDSSRYFPYNTELNDTCSVTNDTGQDCYIFFAFAGATKSEVLTASSYTITWTKSSDI